MKTYHFKNAQAIPISSGPANTIVSELPVEGTGGQITDINVKVQLEHTWTGDLEMRLKNPAGQSVLLVSGRGGSGDNFDETVFDDDASLPVASGEAPFSGAYIPEASLSHFHGTHADGTWQLEIFDRAFQDGGALNAWELEIITDEPDANQGPFLFRNHTPFNISDQGKSTIASHLEVTGLTDVQLDTVTIKIDVDHTFTNDLRISLQSPSGSEVLLVEGEGGGGNHFRDTVFDDAAEALITGAEAPFTGTFRPEGTLSDFNGIDPNGTWTLIVEDQAHLDGGALKSWTLAITTQGSPEVVRPFEIQVRFLGGLTDSQKTIFEEAARRWSEVITGNLPAFQTDIGVVDDLVIDAEGIHIDGQGGILGQAGPTKVRPGSLLPARGIMQFDSGDLQRMEDDGELIDVIIHEMGHVLGIGTLWRHLGLIQDAGTDDPLFTGNNAMREYAALKGLPGPAKVPLANTGGAGTREGHWRESVFDTELMTGYDDPGRNALSRLTIASLQDLGYQVDYDRADPYILPFALLTKGAVTDKLRHRCETTTPDIEILPEENKVS